MKIGGRSMVKGRRGWNYKSSEIAPVYAGDTGTMNVDWSNLSLPRSTGYQHSSQTAWLKHRSYVCPKPGIAKSGQDLGKSPDGVFSSVMSIEHTSMVISRSRKRLLTEPGDNRVGMCENSETRLRDFISVLATLSVKQRADVVSIGFGGLLKVRFHTFPTDMTQWLVENFDDLSQNFCVKGKPKFPISAADVAAIFGLPYEPTRTVEESPINEAVILGVRKDWERMLQIPYARVLSSRDLKFMIAALQDGGPDFKRVFVLYALYAVLIPDSSCVRIGTLKSLVDVEAIKSYNWANFVMERLCESVRVCKVRGEPAAFQGCTILLLLTYFYRCIWKGIALPTDTPLVKHWTSEMIENRVFDERRAGGYGVGLFVPGINPLVRLPARGSSHSYNAPTISFPILGVQNDMELATSIDDDYTRSIATLLRDITVVAASHKLRLNLHPEDFLELGNATQLEPFGPDFDFRQGFDFILNEIRSIKNLVLKRSVRVAPKGEESNRVLGLACGSENLPTTNNFSATFPWPTNKNGVYFSRLLFKCKMWAALPASKEQIEITDYCLANNETIQDREPFFHDGQRVCLNKTDLMTLDLHVAVSPSVVTAFARVLNEEWRLNMCTTRACLEVVTSERLKDFELTGRWKVWLEFCSIDIQNVNLVLIPIHMQNHYVLLVINFKEKQIQYIDSMHREHEEQGAWHQAIHHVICCFWYLLDSLEDSRGRYVRQFTPKILHPLWSTTGRDPDSGVSVMNVMEHFLGLPGEVVKLNLDDVSVMGKMEVMWAKLRVYYCFRIVTCQLNTCIQRVLYSARKFVEYKIRPVAQPQDKLREYFQMLKSRGTN